MLKSKIGARPSGRPYIFGTVNDLWRGEWDSSVSFRYVEAYLQVTVGFGVGRSTYGGACIIEFKRKGPNVERQVVYLLYYEGELAGAYMAVIVVGGTIILELKSVKALTSVIEAHPGCRAEKYPKATIRH